MSAPSTPGPIRLGADGDPDLAAVRDDARAAVGDPRTAIEFSRRLGSFLPLPGHGRTAALFSVLATVAAVDLTVARVVEPHLDALAILDQAGLAASDGAYGVYAAERPGLPPVAASATADGSSVLQGVKPWCSLAGLLDRALLTAVEQDTDGGDAGYGTRRLFEIDLHHPGAAFQGGGWISRGLAAVDTGDLELRDVPARPVGAAGWYLARPGFAWGGIGVAACWFGGATALAGSLRYAATTRKPDQLALAAIGAADRLLWAARCALEDAARRIDDGSAEGSAGALLAARVRGVVSESAGQVLTTVGRALGPAPLTFDEEHARRVADLTVYLRQHHAERDDARAGDALLGDGTGA